MYGLVMDAGKIRNEIYQMSRWAEMHKDFAMKCICIEAKQEHLNEASRLELKIKALELKLTENSPD